MKVINNRHIPLFVTDFRDWPIEQTYSEHLQLLCESKVKQGCVRKPLIQLEPTSCIPDLLHMKKGIISKLLNQLVDWVILQGKEQQLLGEMKRHRIPFRYAVEK